ncbi:hypothetical protein DFP72DRAFT_831239, partial [Ephemerocybe angulata]
LKIPAHRNAISHLLNASHNLAVKRYRYRRHDDGSYIAQDNRPCRYCDDRTESEVHVLFNCGGCPDLVEKRATFMLKVLDKSGPVLRDLCYAEPVSAVVTLLDHKQLCTDFARFTHDVLKMFPL